eukprot:TRINITY_DN21799_c0_g1_i1.p2 TRINITY_DN21799_c0_g1~~TRINITY_DN21799_c0_g1_i1.p2  ORF type:complete len:60 (+),score=0.73 TRINITY_DN21799_c0_g1_i1:288-467(+)
MDTQKSNVILHYKEQRLQEAGLVSDPRSKTNKQTKYPLVFMYMIWGGGEDSDYRRCYFN